MLVVSVSPNLVGMNELKPEQIEYAVTSLCSLVEHRKMKQTDLEHGSRVSQSEISKILRKEPPPAWGMSRNGVKNYSKRARWARNR